MYLKQFDVWAEDKKVINSKSHNHQVRPSEVRWASIGVNIGSEIDGKNKGFTRPVLVISMSGPDLCLVVPLSTKLKDVSGYMAMDINKERVSICIHQIRVISKKRIYGRISKISKNKLDLVKDKIKVYYRL